MNNGYKLSTFQSTVIDKTNKSAMIYVGFMMQIITHYIIIERGIKVKVDIATYNAFDRSEYITGSKYSDGSYPLELS